MHEKACKTPQRKSPGSRERDDHLVTVFALARLAGANLFADRCAAARTDWRGDNNDADRFADSGGLEAALKEANEIVRVIARAVLEDERGIARCGAPRSP